MDETVRVVTELRLRREAKDLDRTMLVAHLQLRCKHTGGLDVRTLRGWENRLHTPSAVYHPVLCDYFRVSSIAELGLGHSLEAAYHWTWETTPERTREVHRRRLLRLTVSGAAASLLPVPALTAAAQILGGQRRLGTADLDAAQQVATHLAASYTAAPDQHVIRAAQAHAYTLLDLLKHASMTAQTRTQLTALAADATSLAGYGHLNAGRLAQAGAWFTEALRLARDAKDRRLEAYALASSAWISLYAPQPDRAKVLIGLEAAAEHVRCLPPAGQAWLFSYLARERATLADDLASGRLLERTRAAAARAQGDDPGWGWWSMHGDLDIRPEVCEGTRLLLLGRPAEALQIYDAALDVTTEPVLRANLQRRVVESCIALDDPDRACASAHAALDEAHTYELALWPQQIRKTRLTFPPQWDMLAPVVELDERLGLAD
jgi:tetratricopeptide (TPR) repeat protein